MEGLPITLRLKKPSTDVVQLTLTLKMTTTRVVETSVTVNNSHIHDYTHYIDTNKYDRCQWCNESNTAASVEHSWLKYYFWNPAKTPNTNVSNGRESQKDGALRKTPTPTDAGEGRYTQIFSLQWRGTCIIDPTLWESGEKTAGIVKLCIVVGSLQSMTGRFQRCTSGVVVFHTSKFGALSTYLNLLRQWTLFALPAMLKGKKLFHQVVNKCRS